MKRIWAIGFFCCLLILSGRPAAATDCADSSIAERVSEAHSIVIGRVVAIDEGVLIRSGPTGLPHTLAIEHVYKGAPADRLTIYQRWTVGAPNLQVGDRWLLFLRLDQSGNPTAGPCTPSMKLAPGEAVPANLAAALGPGRAPAGLGNRTLLLLAAAGAVVIGGGLVLLAVRRRTRHL